MAVNGSRKWTYTYDANGNVDSILNVATGAKKTFTYDKNEKVKKSILGNQSVEYGYDSTGVATSVIGRSGTQAFTQAYTIDKLERLTHLKRNGASQATLTYNKTDELEKISYVNGISSVFKYDAAGQLKTLETKKGTTEFDTFTYEYDTRGNITSVTFKDGTATYEYDANNQLTKEKTVDGIAVSYEYDAVGNRTKKTTVKDGQTITKSYTYNANNQLKTAGSNTYSYDENGNRTLDSQYKYVYNKLNELVEIQTLSGQTVAKYTYNEDGRCISKTVNGQTTYYHYDEDQVLFETDSAGAITAEYSYDDYGRPLMMTRDGKTYYYVLNEHKDVVALTDVSGNIVASYTYDAWGNILSKNGAMADVNPYRYASYRHDNETGLYYLLARYYESKEGVFLTIDPQPGEVNDPLSQHPYAYVQNNPVMLDDPDGENPYVAVLVYTGGRYVVRYVQKKGVKYAAKKYKGKIKKNYKNKSALKKKQKKKKKKSIQMVKDNYLKRKGIDAHSLKNEYVGRKNIAHYDIYVDKNTGRLLIYRKGGKGEPITTHLRIK
ncbi:RHS repeat-associated core domain-containing protein [Bacillus sp. Hm123]|uniref:RHS repeat-associated core domain-containing protein n=1 Tax=Bacillus sp. Hm123 TaxID=3450745 RepID=UPI003F433ED6